MWDWTARRLCNYLHVQLVSECADEDEAEELIAQLTTVPEVFEAESREKMTRQLDMIMPGAIVRG